VWLLVAAAIVLVVAMIAALVTSSAAVFSAGLAVSYLRYRSMSRWTDARRAQLVPVPSADAGLGEILTFAVETFLGEERFGGADGLGRLASGARSTWDRSGRVADSMLVVRGLLFWEATRWRRSGAPLDESTEVYVRALVAKLNDLSVFSGGRVVDDHHPVDVVGKRRLRAASRDGALSDERPSLP